MPRLRCDAESAGPALSKAPQRRESVSGATETRKLPGPQAGSPHPRSSHNPRPPNLPVPRCARPSAEARGATRQVKREHRACRFSNGGREPHDASSSSRLLLRRTPAPCTPPWRALRSRCASLTIPDGVLRSCSVLFVLSRVSLSSSAGRCAAGLLFMPGLVRWPGGVPLH